jgi:hypothetical protein
MAQGKKYSFDSRCYDLAEVFLSEVGEETEENKQELAQHIQDVIEDWLTALHRRKG